MKLTLFSSQKKDNNLQTQIITITLGIFLKKSSKEKISMSSTLMSVKAELEKKGGFFFC